MKISKYPQACFIAETKGQKILLDPGYLKYEDSFFNEWSECPAILITHSHKDHIHEEVVAKLIKNGSALYTSKEVSNVYPSLKANIVKEGDNFNVGDIKVETVGAVHGYLHRFRESNMVIDENIGFIIDDGETRVYHTILCCRLCTGD
jgi:L-ascorbate metabolism protein UlaG (beta-lactamase superfamily)